MPPGVIDPFEPVQIDEHHAVRCRGPSGESERLREPPCGRFGVGKSGQGEVSGAMHQMQAAQGISHGLCMIAELTANEAQVNRYAVLRFLKAGLCQLKRFNVMVRSGFSTRI
jgi:hypothetical protein